MQAEYKEFLALGHGEIFDLDVMRTVVLDKMGEARPPPWHFPGCDLSDYFNYGMDPESWRFYCAIVAAFRCALRVSCCCVMVVYTLYTRIGRWRGKLPRTHSSIARKTSTLMRMARQHPHAHLSQHSSKCSCCSNGT